MRIWQLLDKRLSGNALAKLGSEIIGRVATFGLSLLIANRLGETVFGQYNYGLALGFVLAQIADLGLQVLIARDVAVSGRGMQPLVRAAFRLKLLLAVPVVALLLLTTASRPGPVRAGLLLLGLALLAQTFLEFVAYVYRGQQKVMTEARLLAAARLLTAAVAAAAIFLDGGLVGVGVGYLAGTGTMVLWGIWRLGREGWLRAPDAPAPFSTRATTLLRQALPLGIAIFLSIGYTRLAIFLLQFRLDEVAVAQYSAAHRLVEPTQIVPAALLAAVFPAFSGALHNDPGRARRLGVSSTVLLALGGTALAILFWFGAPFIIPFLYGDAFAESVPVLRFLGLSALPAYVNYSLTHILIARGQQALSSVFVAVMLVAHGAASWFLIPELGPIAPAISVTFAEFILLLLCTSTLLVTRPRLASQIRGVN